MDARHTDYRLVTTRHSSRFRNGNGLKGILGCAGREAVIPASIRLGPQTQLHTLEGAT
jgi:hypothetical protein